MRCYTLDLTQPLHRTQQMMMNTQFHFTTYLQFGGHEHIQSVVDSTFCGVFYRHNTVVGLAAFHRTEYILDGRHG